MVLRSKRCAACFAVWFGCFTAAAHAVTLVVAPHGDDANPGTEDAPLRTISRAAEKAMPGDTVLVREGVYRERVTPPRGGEPGREITYRGAPGERVVVKGSEAWQPQWRDEGGGVYSASPDKRLFDDLPDDYPDSHNPLKVRLASTPWGREGLSEAILRDQGEDRIGRADRSIAYTCGQVFVDGEQLKEVAKRAELVDDAWCYNPDEDRVYVQFGEEGPASCLVELTTRRRLFAPTERGLGHIVVTGFVFEHCGNQYPTNFWSIDANAQKGAVGTQAGHHWVIRRNVIRHAKTFALDVGKVDRHSLGDGVVDNVVEENYVLENGSAGILSNGSVRLVVRNNVILRNNLLRFDGIKRWEQAGVKCHHFQDGLIEGNYIGDSYSMYGVWLDNQFLDGRVTKNVIVGSGVAGVFLEMSDYDFDSVRIDHNVILDSHRNAVYIHDASGGTFDHNLLANTHDTPGYGQAVLVKQVTQRTCSGRHTFRDNLLIGNAKNVEVNYPAERSDVQRFDRNLYDARPGDKVFVVNASSDKPTPWNDRQFAELIAADLGRSASPTGLAIAPLEASMTLPVWREFWRRHGVNNDAGSVVSDACSVQHDRNSHTLRLTLPSQWQGEAASVASLQDAGPFGKLKPGVTTRRIWDGLPTLPEGALPDVDWTVDAGE